MIIKFCKLEYDAVIPKFATEYSSGFDLHALESYVLASGCHALIRTGLSVEIPHGYEIQIRSRSGLALNNGIFVLNSPGTIDSDYRGEIKIILMNFGSDFEIKKGDRIAQGVVAAVPRVQITQVDSISKTHRGDGGFGSTGI